MIYFAPAEILIFNYSDSLSKKKFHKIHGLYSSTRSFLSQCLLLIGVQRHPCDVYFSSPLELITVFFLCWWPWLCLAEEFVFHMVVILSIWRYRYFLSCAEVKRRRWWIASAEFVSVLSLCVFLENNVFQRIWTRHYVCKFLTILHESSVEQ